MSNSILAWLLVAILVFWAVGAYNRLVRLRSQGLVAFGALEGIFRQYLALASSQVAVEPAPAITEAIAAYRVALDRARVGPLDPRAIEALRLCHDRLMRFQRENAAAQALAVAQSGEQRRIQWEQLHVQAEIARADFNRQVDNYNEAISQFPAMLLVVLIGFRPAQPL